MGVGGQHKGVISARLGYLSPIIAPKANNRNKAVFKDVKRTWMILRDHGEGGGKDIRGGNCRPIIVVVVMLQPSGATMLKSKLVMEANRASRVVGWSIGGTSDDRWGVGMVTFTIGMVAAAKEGKHGGSAMVNPLKEA